MKYLSIVGLPLAVALLLLTSSCTVQQPISSEPPKNNDTYTEVRNSIKVNKN